MINLNHIYDRTFRLLRDAFPGARHNSELYAYYDVMDRGFVFGLRVDGDNVKHPYDSNEWLLMSDNAIAYAISADLCRKMKEAQANHAFYCDTV